MKISLVKELHAIFRDILLKNPEGCLEFSFCGWHINKNLIKIDYYSQRDGVGLYIYISKNEFKEYKKLQHEVDENISKYNVLIRKEHEKVNQYMQNLLLKAVQEDKLNLK